jgi:hypothetical protein
MVGVRHIFVAVAATGLLLVAACGDDDDGGGEGPFELSVHPEFVQGALPGIPVTVLVTVNDLEGGAGEVTLSGSFTEGTVEVSPESVAAGEIAEVTLTAGPVAEEIEATLTITGQRGSEERSVSRTLFVMPGTDELGPMAADLLDVFATWLAENQPELGITPEREFQGNLVAPRLLVVSHYMFADEEYELGLSWHVTIQPHDWSELYIRPRDELAPTRAFRVSSWSAALEGEDVEFTEVSPPEEIVR